MSGPARRGHACCGSPGRAQGERVLSRAGFLGVGLAAAAVVAGWYAPRANAATSVQLWGLDPNWGGDPGLCGCGACAACRSHAANKLFASASDADGGRAHSFCKCLVIPLVLVDESIYNALFVDGGPRASVDRRSQWVQAVLARGPSVPDPLQKDGPAGGNESGSGTSDVVDISSDDSAVSDTIVTAVLRGVRIRRRTNGRRVLYADIDAAEIVTARLGITRKRVTLASRTIAGINGRRTLRLAIPPSVGVGPARLELNLSDAAGNSALVTRGIHIPRRKRAATRT